MLVEGKDTIPDVTVSDLGNARASEMNWLVWAGGWSSEYRWMAALQSATQACQFWSFGRPYRCFRHDVQQAEPLPLYSTGIQMSFGRCWKGTTTVFILHLRSGWRCNGIALFYWNRSDECHWRFTLLSWSDSGANWTAQTFLNDHQPVMAELMTVGSVTATKSGWKRWTQSRWILSQMLRGRHHPCFSGFLHRWRWFTRRLSTKVTTKYPGLIIVPEGANYWAGLFATLTMPKVTLPHNEKGEWSETHPF